MPTPISDTAVKNATGRSWGQWLAILDKAGARKMVHKDIARLLAEKHKVSPWWSQMVTVGYEQARGMREKHEKADGYAISASKTMNVPIATLYAAWVDARRRAKWLTEKITVRKANENKSMRITWSDGESVTVMFYVKGDDKSQVTVDHEKIGEKKRAMELKAFWGERVEKLKEMLEG